MRELSDKELDRLLERLYALVDADADVIDVMVGASMLDARRRELLKAHLTSKLSQLDGTWHDGGRDLP